MTEYDLVDERFRQEAHARLLKRIAAGETVESILKMPEDDYYVKKIVAGLVPMSYIVYDRIMGCSREDKA